MATSPIYNWPEPDNTDLVKNGALAIRTLGNAIDTTMATMVPKTIVDAKGDLIAGTAADTAARLAVGNNGETLVADSSTSTGLRYQSNFSAGKNAIINGAFNVWQRGTSFSPATGVGAFTADRYFVNCNFTAGTATFSQQTFTPGTAPVAGYEGTFFHRIAAASTTSYFEMSQKIEDVRTYAGQTITVSFWAKQSASNSFGLLIRQNFGSGGSANVDQSVFPTITSSWARYSYTFTLGSLAGKTIGAGSYVQMYLYTTGAVTGSMTFDTWGWQVEAGNTATAFQTATGTIQGELAACQRYYTTWNSPVGTTDAGIGTGFASSTTSARIYIPLPVRMRTTPTTLDRTASGLALNEITAGYAVSSLVFQGAVNNPQTVCVTATVASGLTQWRPYFFNVQSSTSFGIGAEL